MHYIHCNPWNVGEMAQPVTFLDQLRQASVVVADTSDLEAIRYVCIRWMKAIDFKLLNQC